MNPNSILPQLPFLLTILAVFIAYGVMVRREILTGARVWQGGIVIGLIAVGLAVLNDRLNLKLLPGMSPTFYLMNPAAMAFCATYCVFISYRLHKVTDIATWAIGDTKIILRTCPASKLPDAHALILPTGTRLEMRFGIPSQVKNAGGDTIPAAANKIAPVGLGKVVATEAGTLAVGKIYHVAVYESNKPIKVDVLKRFIGQALLAARKDGAESVCIPLGTYPGLSIESSTTALAETVLKHHKPFAEIVFCIFEARDERDATGAVRKVLGESSPVPKRDIPLPPPDKTAK
ncbi:MAG: macro domain-containing protein [Fibrella sp.]|nr:macro domain-containing protein [Armatimonadota bacterium]